MSLYLARYLNVPPDRIPGEGGGAPRWRHARGNCKGRRGHAERQLGNVCRVGAGLPSALSRQGFAEPGTLESVTRCTFYRP